MEHGTEAGSRRRLDAVMPSLIDEQPLKITEVATRFRVHRRTVERWFRTGLEHYRLGTNTFTTLEALGRFALVTRPVPVNRIPPPDPESASIKEELRERFGLTY